MTTHTTLNKVQRACPQLQQDGKDVTFTAVAAAGLGRTTLYRDPAIRAVIEEHRRRTAASGTLTSITDDIATLRAAVETLAANVRKHEEQLRRLERRQG